MSAKLTAKDFQDGKIYRCISNICLVEILFKLINGKVAFRGIQEIEASWRLYKSNNLDKLEFKEHKNV